MRNCKKYVYTGLPLLGVLFYLLYLHAATIDIIYSDYIRLFNSYLPDIWNPKKFFVPDLLTRIPVNYLERAVNVQFLGYSVTFDRFMGVCSFGLSALLVAGYSRRESIGIGWYSGMMVFMFSLNKWEMLYNGTGWVHFLAFACFYYHYLVLDRVYGQMGKKGDALRLALLPACVTILVAGPYCAIYIVTLVLAYGFIYLRGRFGSAGHCVLDAGRLAGLLVLTGTPLLLYLWSHSKAVYEYSGASDAPFLATFLEQPLYFVKFFLKSFASMVFGTEWITRRMDWVPGKVWCLVGLLVIGVYVLALWMNFYYGIVNRTIFPLMLLAGGGMNHLMILVTRWIFIPKDIYGMSSRYALQYQIGIVGIFLTFALAAKEFRSARRLERALKRLAVAAAVVLIAGNVLTTAEEFSFAKHRKIHNQHVHVTVWNFENETDEALAEALEYNKEGTREALTLMKEHRLNIFREEEPPFYPAFMEEPLQLQ